MIGGLLLGYGARIAYGCNIGAYFSGIASGSLHGWLWLVAAFAGNIAGTSLQADVRSECREEREPPAEAIRQSGNQVIAKSRSSDLAFS